MCMYNVQVPAYTCKCLAAVVVRACKCTYLAAATATEYAFLITFLAYHRYTCTHVQIYTCMIMYITMYTNSTLLRMSMSIVWSLQIDGEGGKDGERLSRVVGLFGPGREPPIIKPKPKPKTRPRPVQHTLSDQTDAPTDESPGAMVGWCGNFFDMYCTCK